MRILLGLALAAALWGEEARSYRIFRGDGTAVSMEDLIAKAKESSVVFLGESHDDPTGHALELEILKRMKSEGPVTLSLEMFESDVQPVLDEYLYGMITEEHLLASGRAWKNYKTDYRPMVEFAKAERLPVVAANAPRRYVNRVSRLGAAALIELPAGARVLLPPLPYADASGRYGAKFHDVMKKQQQERKIDPVKSLAAQSLWDASMAHAIAEVLRRTPERKVVQVNGSFHSEDRLGILDHLERYRPGTRSTVITMLSHQGFPDWQTELAGKGDFVIVTDPALPRSMK